jgi:hypothetical protein
MSESYFFSSQINEKKLPPPIPPPPPPPTQNNTIHPNLGYLKWAKLKLLEDFILPNFPFLI